MCLAEFDLKGLLKKQQDASSLPSTAGASVNLEGQAALCAKPCQCMASVELGRTKAEGKAKLKAAFAIASQLRLLLQQQSPTRRTTAG